ncbi:MAG: hypothetical protein F6K35_27635 [Okeania sp. SIO2H7]|uniref:hypothetical protein n=1 Tax=unclassified Okeania TaxID=2634635 RepID=UPI0013BC9244|nr:MULTISPECIES: hypothetical protein [unclassified Okeania]NEP42790.1 hypothetical protein [Okeania sp. SIO2H7]NEP74007.1 hypothetical protein [Okeania sp. SIO2G5]NEP97062.1 hypothetical protein [Okeania sp. SIO2F5]
MVALRKSCDIKNVALVKRVYDINLNYLGVRSQDSGVRREEEKGVEGESFLVA